MKIRGLFLIILLLVDSCSYFKDNSFFKKKEDSQVNQVPSFSDRRPPALNPRGALSRMNQNSQMPAQISPQQMMPQQMPYSQQMITPKAQGGAYGAPSYGNMPPKMPAYENSKVYTPVTPQAVDPVVTPYGNATPGQMPNSGSIQPPAYPSASKKQAKPSMPDYPNIEDLMGGGSGLGGGFCKDEAATSGNKAESQQILQKNLESFNNQSLDVSNKMTEEELQSLGVNDEDNKDVMGFPKLKAILDVPQRTVDKQVEYGKIRELSEERAEIAAKREELN